MAYTFSLKDRVGQVLLLYARKQMQGTDEEVTGCLGLLDCSSLCWLSHNKPRYAQGRSQE